MSYLENEQAWPGKTRIASKPAMAIKSSPNSN
jgi:hypothetical protein